MPSSLPALLIGNSRFPDNNNFSGNNTANFFPLLVSTIDTIGNAEAWNQYAVGAAGNLSNIFCTLVTNTRGTNSTLKDRKNGVDGGLAVSIIAGATGDFEDVSNTSAYTPGDLICGCVQNGSGGGNQVIQYIRALFTPTTGMVQFCGMVGEPQLQFNTHNYMSPMGYCSFIIGNSTDLNYAMYCRAGGTFTNMQTYVSTNAQAGSVTMKFRVSSVDGNQAISIGAGATGFFQDTTHSDAVTNADTAQYHYAMFDGGTFKTEMMGSLFTSSSNKIDLLASSMNEFSGSNNVANFQHIAGVMTMSFGTAEAKAQLKMPFDCRASGLRYLKQYDFTAVTTCAFRQNGSNGNMAVSIPVNTSLGLYEDTTNHDDITAGDLVCLAYTCGTSGSIYFHTTGITLEPVTGPAPGGGGYNLIMSST
jgi:hypothetical protein